MGRTMSWDFGLQGGNLCMPRKHRWLFEIPSISAEGANTLPPLKSARPSVSFKEHEVQHATETIFIPQKAEWKPVNLTLYEPTSQTKPHPVFEWLKRLYDAENGIHRTVVSSGIKVPTSHIRLYDGCGNTIETWVFEGVWPQNIEFGDLDMGDSGIVTVDLTLRYDRAYIKSSPSGFGGGGGYKPDGPITLF